MRKLLLAPLLLLLALLQPRLPLPALEEPPLLDCTRPEGADARTVGAAQKAWAKYLGETSHEQAFPLDKAGKVKVEMILLPPGKYYRGEGKNTVLVTLQEHRARHPDGTAVGGQVRGDATAVRGAP